MKIASLFAALFMLLVPGFASAAVMLATYSGTSASGVSHSVTIPIETAATDWTYQDPPFAPYEAFYGEEAWIGRSVEGSGTAIVDGTTTAGNFFGYEFWHMNGGYFQNSSVGQPSGPSIGLAILTATSPTGFDAASPPATSFVANPIGSIAIVYEVYWLWPSASFTIESFSISAIPEPSTWAMLAVGIAAIGAMLRRQRGQLAVFAFGARPAIA